MARRTLPLILVVSILITIVVFAYARSQSAPPIRVGVLHSLTGTMALSEAAVVDATLMAVEEINAAGGLLGRQIEPLVVDGESDWERFAQEAERLITDEKVDVVFGCWTSVCRKTVKPVFEAHDHLLIYPIQYEGLENSPNIIYTGSSPNQQITPAVSWAIRTLGARLYLVGSDYVFPHTANAIMRATAAALGGEIIGESYLLLGSSDVSGVIADIEAQQPDVILNTINGDSNIAFFEALRQAGITPDSIPTVSFSFGEAELSTMPLTNFVGDYVAATYFQSIDRPQNAAFVERFKVRYGADRVTSDSIEAGYFGVYLWAQSVSSLGTTEVSRVRHNMGGQSLDAPQGVVYVDLENNHTWKSVRIGQIRADGQVDVVWQSDHPIRPDPFPVFRAPDEWGRFLTDLYEGWGGSWVNPASQEIASGEGQ